MNNNEFMNEGVHRKDTEIVKEPISPSPIVTAGVVSFIDIVKEYALFTHAPLLLYGGLPFDPLSQFIAKYGLPGGPKVIMVDEPIFEGLETPSENAFNHILFGVPIRVWEQLALYLGTIDIKDSVNRTYFSVVVQKFPLVDYLALRRHQIIPGQIPFVEVYGTALDGNKACLHFQPAIQPPVDRVKFVRSKPLKATINFANSVFAGKPDLDLRNMK